ncbi:MAG: hypothetical protein V8Q30_08485 [Acutalibacteraceae bacterium]
MAVQESLRPQPVKTTDQRRPVRQALAATAASLGLLAGVVAAGAALSGSGRYRQPGTGRWQQSQPCRNTGWR